MFSLIAAIDEHYGIGLNNRLLARLPNDLKHFKRVTSGHPVVMGRRTYESLPVKPLPGRKNIVVSASLSSVAQGCVLVPSVAAAVAQCSDNEECFVMGGMQLYRQMMPLAQKLYITRIHYRFEADVFFPEIDPDGWQLLSSERHEADEQHLYAYSFEIYDRRIIRFC
ncbi:MAG: dihydrofolate reductase [Bacteroidales bacterium]|jgi:dihydrofolate reductase|nr:dihydrofolate reductase [Bacteroidales bacterium]